MQTIWKRAVSFGLVNVPVKMFTATQENDIAMKMLHKEFHVPIHFARTCPKCDGEVKWSETVMGYEYEPGHFVTFEKEEKKRTSSTLWKRCGQAYSSVTRPARKRPGARRSERRRQELSRLRAGRRTMRTRSPAPRSGQSGPNRPDRNGRGADG